MAIRLPLFPLHTVLFPGQVLPLHIFEPRYRRMISECLRDGAPFGVVLIREGAEVGAAAKPASVGTTARIAQVDTLADGRMNIVTVGEARFVVHAVHAERPYLEATATIERWPDEASPALTPLAGRVLSLLQSYLLELGDGDNSTALSQLPKSALLVATAAAAVPSIPLQERQYLLEMHTLEDVLKREAALLQQEHTLLRALGAMDTPARDPKTPFNVN
jgi:Lon protease-like protein